MCAADAAPDAPFDAFPRLLTHDQVQWACLDLACGDIRVEVCDGFLRQRESRFGRCAGEFELQWYAT